MQHQAPVPPATVMHAWLACLSTSLAARQASENEGEVQPHAKTPKYSATNVSVEDSFGMWGYCLRGSS